MTLIFKNLRLLLALFIIIQSNCLFAQLTKLENGNYLIFPNWEEGDRKIMESETIETKIYNNDTISLTKKLKNLITVKEKNKNFYILALTDLTENKENLIEYNQKFEGINESNQFSNKIQVLIKSIFLKERNTKTINYKVDKWGYYKGLSEKLKLDSLNKILKKEISQLDELKNA